MICDRFLSLDSSELLELDMKLGAPRSLSLISWYWKVTVKLSISFAKFEPSDLGKTTRDKSNRVVNSILGV